MTVRIAPELEAQVRHRAKAEGLSVEAYLERLIRQDEGWGERAEPVLSEKDPEFAEIYAAVSEGLEQAERAEAKPAGEVFRALRAKHGLSR